MAQGGQRDGAESQRQNGCRADEADELRPAWKWQEQQESQDEVEYERPHRDPRRVELQKEAGELLVLRQRVVDARGGARVGERRSRRRQHGVEIKRGRQPLHAEEGGEGRERSARHVLRKRAPSVRQMRRRHGADEGHLQHQVDDKAHDHGADDRQRHGGLRISRFARHVDGGTEAEQREHDAAGRYRGKNARRRPSGQSRHGREVGAVEARR